MAQFENETTFSGKYVEAYRTHSYLRIDHVLQQIELLKQDRVVDIACGNGMLADRISARVASYAGVDFSEEFIKECELKYSGKTGSTLSFYRDSVDHFSMGHLGEFDKAFLLDCLNCVSDPLCDDFVSSAYRLLSARGKIYLHVPNGNFFLERLRRGKVIRKRNDSPYVRSPDFYSALLRKHGFEKIEEVYLSHYNVLKFLHFFSYLPVVGIWFRARVLFVAEKKASKGR